MTRIAIIIGSTRPGRKAEAVARWVYDLASQRDDATFELVDLADYHLPHLDEPMPAAHGPHYSHDHTRAWAATIASFDAYVFVTPEYNHSTSGVLKDALDFLFTEWNDKAAGFVSYGLHGGTRAVEHLRLVMGELQIADVRTQVALSLFTDFDNGIDLRPGAHQSQTVHTMLDQLVTWAAALKTIRSVTQPEQRATVGTFHAEENVMSLASFDSSYRGAPLWEIGRPQPAVVELAEQGQFLGAVLDVGCGTGENALYLASRGHTVLGIDGAPTAVELARAKAKQRGLTAEFAVADALELAQLAQKFDTVLDSAFLHTMHDAARRRAYTEQLAAVLPPQGQVHLLQISERVTGNFPSLARSEITDAFDNQWTVETVQDTTYMVTTGGVAAWLVSVRRQ